MLRDLLLRLKIYNLLRIQMLPLAEINDHLPKKGKILELGCGDGFISEYLARLKSRNVTGIDLDLSRLPKTTNTNIKFKREDIRTYRFTSFDGIIISDVLHHLNYKDQGDVLGKISHSLKKGSVLIIKEIDTKEFIRSRLSRFWDLVFYPRDRIYYWNSPVLLKKLADLGFGVKMLRTNRLYPASTTLYICTKS